MQGESDGRKIPNHAYVIAPDYQLVSLDEETRKLYPEARVGDKCFVALQGLSQACEDCPWRMHLESGINQAVLFNHLLNAWVDLSYMSLEWPDHGECILINARGIDQNQDLLHLFDRQARYDKLTEVNLTKDYINRLFVEHDKYVDFPPDGSVRHIFDKTAETVVHPDDRATYLAFWDIDALKKLFDENKSAQAEYRRKLTNGGWGWVSQVVIPMKQSADGDIVFMCFMVDVDMHLSQSRKQSLGGQGYPSHLLGRDPLTGLYTSNAFFEKAEALVHGNSQTLFDVLYIDIEHFKVFNERYGREAGDTILKTIAQELLALEKAHGGIIGYIGSDDFIFILPHEAIEPEEVAKRLSAAINDPAYDVECLPAIGLTTITDPSIPVSTYCDHAMTAMDSAKGMYSSRIAWYEDTMTRQLEEEPKAMIEIEHALKNREFILHYQPKCNLKTSQMVGLEALVRWQHPTRGLVYPGEFIPLMERTGLIANLDLLVWEEACRQIREWLDRGIPALPISVNISRADLQFVDVVSSLESLIEEYGIDRSYLELEITESAFVDDTAVLETVINLSDHGFTLLMDDFGSGYSSLNMLKDIPVDILKIDMKFLKLSENVLFRGESILDAVVSMAHLMGMPVIAEGAETEEQAEFLKSINCDFVQGYYFYRPIPVSNLEALLVQDDIIDRQGTNRKHLELLSPVDLIQNYVTNKTILDAILGGIAIYSVRGRELELVQANNRYFQLVGDNPPSDEADRLDFFRRAPKEVVEETVDLLLDSEKHPITGAEEEFCQRRADGLYIWIRVKAFFLTKEGDRKIFFGRLTDISIQKDQEDILRASEDALGKAVGLLTPHEGELPAGQDSAREAIAAFIRNLPGAMVGLADTERNPILFANNEVASMLGYVSYSEFIEKSQGEFQRLIHPDDRGQFEDYLMCDQHGGPKGMLKVRLIRKSGTYVSVFAQCKVVAKERERSLIMLNLINMDKVGDTRLVNLGG